MSDPHRDEDPGWFSVRSLLTAFVPWVGLRQAQKEVVNTLSATRRLFTAFANAAALVGFVGFFLADTWWLYPLGAAFAVVGFVRLAPTQSNIQRDQEALNLSGCGQSLIQVLTSTNHT